MTMKKLSMCRICLVENVRMYVVVNKHLQEMYEKLTNIPLVTQDSRPMLVCYFCITKLKQCCRLQKKCLETEEMFDWMLNEDYQRKPGVNQGQLKFNSYIISPTEHISIFYECETERDVIKTELPDDFERQDNIVELQEEHQTESEHEFQAIENVFIPTRHSESEDVPTQHSESDSKDDLLLMQLKTEVEEEQEVYKTKQHVEDTKRATVAKKPKIYIRRRNLGDTSAVLIKQTEYNFSNNVIDIGDINRHRRLDIEEKPYKCEICQKSFYGKGNLTVHMRVHTKEKPCKCEICQKSFNQKGSIRVHMPVHTKEKPYKCDICQKSFNQKGHFTVHMRVHTKEKPYKCEICQKSFNEKGYLTVHMRVHTKEKPYKCEICQKSFNQKGNLTVHMRVHPKEKPYKCEICQKSFNKKGSIRVHMLAHTEENPYKCEICQKSFYGKSNLTVHMRVHTKEKPYKCEICQKSFNQKGSIRVHMRVHTKEKPYKYEICQKSFN